MSGGLGCRGVNFVSSDFVWVISTGAPVLGVPSGGGVGSFNSVRDGDETGATVLQY